MSSSELACGAESRQIVIADCNAIDRRLPLGLLVRVRAETGRLHSLLLLLDKGDVASAVSCNDDGRAHSLMLEHRQRCNCSVVLLDSLLDLPLH